MKKSVELHIFQGHFKNNAQNKPMQESYTQIKTKYLTQ